MKLIDVKSNTYIESSTEIDDENPKFIFRDTVTISKYKNMFAKDYTPRLRSEEVFLIKKS